MTKHTPTPLAVQELVTLWLVQQTDRGPMPIANLGKASDLGREYAAYIARAVNAHDELLAALEACLDSLQGGLTPDEDSIKAAEASIAKARG